VNAHASGSDGRAKPRLFGKLLWVSGGRFGAAVIQAVTLIVVARAMAPSEFGLLAGVLGLASLVQSVSDFGIGTFVSVERARDPDSGAIRSALNFNALTSSGLLVVILLGIAAAGTFLDSAYWFMAPLALWASGERNADTRLAIMFADGDVWINVSNLILRRTGALGLLAVLIHTDLDPLLAYSASIAVAAAISSTAANVLVRKRVTREGTMSYRRLMRESRPFWIHSVATQARNVDTVLVTLAASATQAGFFSSARRLTTPLLLIPSSLANLLLPAASRSVAAGTSLRPLIKVVAVLVASMSVIYGIVFAAAASLLPALLGQAYAPSVDALRIVLLGMPFAAASSVLASLLQGGGRKSFVAAVSVCMVFASLSFVLAGALIHGATGASCGVALSMLLHSLVLVAGFWRSFGKGASLGSTRRTAS